MNKIKKGMFFLAITFFTNSLFAQSIEDGKKFMYYEKYKSAKDVFQKLLAANPNNDEAAYLLGQAMILPEDHTSKDVADAKAFYQSNLTANPQSGLLIAGIGHIELIEGKTQDARNHFEAAISLSQGKSIAVLNAIGFANANQKNGDAAYAIDKLKQATQIKKFNDPDVWVNLGDAYRKAGDGGNATSAYQNALTIDPKYARANYRIGKIYQTQGHGQDEIIMKYYNDAIAQDPAYAPLYNNLFNYYYLTDVNKSADYLDKWLKNSDPDPKDCYYRASITYAQGLFRETITKADECIAAGGSSPYPALYGLKAYAYNKLNDSVNAKSFFEEYFNKQLPEKLGGGDYSTYAALLLKFPGNEEKAGMLIDHAVALDSIETNKVNYLKTIAQAYEAQKKAKEAAGWYGKIVDIKKGFTNVDLFNAGYNYYAATQFDSSSKYFTMYTAKYPNDIMGFYMLGNINATIDSTGALGSAIPFYQKTIDIGEADTTKPAVKPKLLSAYNFFSSYYYNVKKDQAIALTYVDKAIALNPNDPQLQAKKDYITKNDPKAPPKKAAPAKPAAKPKA